MRRSAQGLARAGTGSPGAFAGGFVQKVVAAVSCGDAARRTSRQALKPGTFSRGHAKAGASRRCAKAAAVCCLTERKIQCQGRQPAVPTARKRTDTGAHTAGWSRYDSLVIPSPFPDHSRLRVGHGDRIGLVIPLRVTTIVISPGHDAVHIHAATFQAWGLGVHYFRQ